MRNREVEPKASARVEDGPAGLGRREQILDAALAVYVKDGVASATHRKIATEANVPLGSLTYYFTGLHDLHCQALDRLMSRMSARFDDALASARTREEAVEVVIDLTCGDAYADADELTLTYEMYVYARHQPAAAALINEWLSRSQASLRRHFPPHVARALDALIEGWPLHQAFESEPLDRGMVRRAVEAIARSA